jgi:hypothetical protein
VIINWLFDNLPLCIIKKYYPISLNNLLGNQAWLSQCLGIHHDTMPHFRCKHNPTSHQNRVNLSQFWVNLGQSSYQAPKARIKMTKTGPIG